MTASLPLVERVHILTKTYALIQTYFAHWQAIPDIDLDALYAELLTRALAGDDRYTFGLAMMRFLGRLRNGHTWYVDPWLNEHHGQPLGFDLAPLADGTWIVRESDVPELHPGDAVTHLDGQPIEPFFQANRDVIFASSERAARWSFHQLRVLLPHRLRLVLEDGREVIIDRTTLAPPAYYTAGRWIVPGQVAYINVPAFDRAELEERALAYVAEFQDADSLIVDLRGKGRGGATPGALLKRLMDRPYRSWSVSTPAVFGLYRAYGELLASPFAAQLNTSDRAALELAANFRHSSLAWPATYESPGDDAYTGRLYLLVDATCVSATEDFIAPFKDNRRATIIGQTTLGSTGQPQIALFERGIKVFVGTLRASMPDGSPFEGVGIVPDVPVPLTRDALRAGRDTMLERALQLAQSADG